jgi:hypothetical protein
LSPISSFVDDAELCQQRELATHPLYDCVTSLEAIDEIAKTSLGIERILVLKTKAEKSTFSMNVLSDSSVERAV